MALFDGAVVVVTGANGGLGSEFVRQALQRGAAKVYATARTPKDWNDPRIVSLALDVTDPESVAAAASVAKDATVLINNAGVGGGHSVLGSEMAEVRRVFETNFFGALQVAKAFASVIRANGGGAIVDIHSVLSWIGLAGAYSASKAAFWSLTNSLRLELAADGIQVVGVHLGYTDTPMTAGVTDPKNDPADVVRDTLDGIEAGELEILADQISRDVKAGLSGPISALYPQLAVR